MAEPKTNPLRLRASMMWGALGVLGVVVFSVAQTPNWREWVVSNWTTIVWCSSWSAIGIALGLYNSRTNNSAMAQRPIHYLRYFLFVWFFSFLVALGFSEILTGSVRGHVVAAALAIATGFAGDSLAGRLGPPSNE